jgi:hypothetical protein
MTGVRKFMDILLTFLATKTDLMIISRLIQNIGAYVKAHPKDGQVRE